MRSSLQHENQSPLREIGRDSEAVRRVGSFVVDKRKGFSLPWLEAFGMGLTKSRAPCVTGFKAYLAFSDWSWVGIKGKRCGSWAITDKCWALRVDCLQRLELASWAGCHRDYGADFIVIYGLTIVQLYIECIIYVHIILNLPNICHDAINTIFDKGKTVCKRFNIFSSNFLSAVCDLVGKKEGRSEHNFIHKLC